MASKVIGIDPGMDGGIAILEEGKIVALHKMPTFEIDAVKDKKKVKKNHIDAVGLVEILAPHFNEGVAPEVYIEELTHLFGLPPASNFKLGYSVGMIHCVLQRFGPFYQIHPLRWQKIAWGKEDRALNKNGKLDKKATALNAAMRLYPDQSLVPEGSRKPHNGCTDALLIATVGASL